MRRVGHLTCDDIGKTATLYAPDTMEKVATPPRLIERVNHYRSDAGWYMTLLDYGDPDTLVGSPISSTMWADVR